MAQQPCVGCPDGAIDVNTNNPIKRKQVTIKVKAIVLVPENAAVGAYEATAQKGVSDALSVGGALIQSVTSKTKES